MRKIRIFLENAVGTMLLFLFGYILFCSIFKIHNQSEKFKPIILIFGTVVVIGILIKLYRVIEKKSFEKYTKFIVIILCIIFFLGLLLVRI